MMQDLANTLSAILILSLMGTGFSLIERLAPAQPAQSSFRKDTLTDLAYLPLNVLLIGPGLALLMAPVAYMAEVWTPAGFRAAVAGQPIWLQLIAVAVLADLGVYVGHRLMHALPWLWRFHAIHHSAREVDWITAFRIHPVDQLVIRFFMLLPLIPFAFSAAALAGFAFFYAVQSAFVHANLRVTFGRFALLYASPDFHRWHHSDLPEVRDKNFVSIFPWIDRLFGTYFQAPAAARTFGTDEPVPASYAGQIVYPFVPGQRVSGKAKA